MTEKITCKTCNTEWDEETTPDYRLQSFYFSGDELILCYSCNKDDKRRIFLSWIYDMECKLHTMWYYAL